MKYFIIGVIVSVNKKEVAMPQKTSSIKLIKAFLPYYGKYLHILFFDLACAGFSTLCDLFLPVMLRFLTNTAKDLNLTMDLIFKCAALFFFLRKRI